MDEQPRDELGRFASALTAWSRSKEGPAPRLDAKALKSWAGSGFRGRLADLGEEHGDQDEAAREHQERADRAHQHVVEHGPRELREAQAGLKAALMRHASEAAELARAATDPGRAEELRGSHEELRDAAKDLKPAWLDGAVAERVAKYERIRAMPNSTERERERQSDRMKNHQFDDDKVLDRLGLTAAHATINRFLIARDAPPLPKPPDNDDWYRDDAYMRRRGEAIDARQAYGVKPGRVPELDRAREALMNHTEAMMEHVEAANEARDARARADKLARPLALIARHVVRRGGR